MAEGAVSLNEVLKQEENHENVGAHFTILYYDEQSVTSDKDCGNHILNLPEEVILEIFKSLRISDLRRCAFTCKKWYNLHLKSLLWREVSLTGIKINIISVERILNCGVRNFYLKSSQINNQMTLIPPFFISEKFESLQHLHIIKTGIKSNLLNTLLTLAAQLKSVKLYRACGTITNGILRKLFDLEFLETLDISENKLQICEKIVAKFNTSKKYNLKHFAFDLFSPEDVSILKDFLKILFPLCPNMLTLTIGKCIDVNGEILKHILNMQYIKELSLCSKSLRTADINGGILHNHGKFYNLHKLNFEYVNFKLLPQFFEFSPYLEVIKLTACFIPESTFRQIVNLNYLQHLMYRNCNFELYADTHVQSLKTPLRKLQISRSGRLTANLLDKWLLNYKYLEEVFISDACVNLMTILNLLKLRSLKYLDLASLQVVFQNRTFDLKDCVASQLETLCLNTLQVHFSAADIGLVLSLCPNVTYLDLTSCKITKCVVEYVLHMKNLRTLMFFAVVVEDFCGNMSNLHCEDLCNIKTVQFSYAFFHEKRSILELLLPFCRRAKELHLGNLVMTASIYSLILKMKDLEYLALKSVSGFPPGYIRDVCNNCPKVRGNIRIV